MTTFSVSLRIFHGFLEHESNVFFAREQVHAPRRVEAAARDQGSDGVEGGWFGRWDGGVGVRGQGAST